MTNQEIFDFGYIAIYNQGDASSDEKGTCYYRHPDGIRKCVVGQFITYEEYSPSMEGETVYPNPNYGPYTDNELKVQRLFESKNINLHLMKAMQNAHDEASDHRNFLDVWKIEMRKVAERFELSAEVIKD